MPTRLENARADMEKATATIDGARAELALAICDEAKQTVTSVVAQIEPLEALLKGLPAQGSLDNSARKRLVAKTTTEILLSLKDLRATLVTIQEDWQEGAQ